MLSAVYAYALAYMPVAGYVTCVLSAGFGALAGSATASALKLGKVRNTRVTTLAGAAVGLVALYLSWVLWIYARLRRGDVTIELFNLALWPPLLAEQVARINAAGSWTIREFRPTGTTLGMFWAVEAALIVVSAALFARASSRTFCEACGVWCETTQGITTLPPSDAAQLRRRMETRDFSVLGSAAPGSMTFLRVDVSTCPQCYTLHTLDVIRVTRASSAENDYFRTRRLVSGLLISTADLAQLRQPARPVATMLQAT